MTLPPVATLSFWFNPVPPPFLPFFDRAILVICFTFVIVGILAYVMRARSKMDIPTQDAVASAANTLLITGFVGLILYGIAFERVMYLSMRIFWIPLIAWFVWRVVIHWKTVTREIPKIQKALAEREQFEKWLPKRKR